MQIAHLQHKHGGRITAIHSVAHSTYKGVADWYYVGDIEWKDGGKSLGREIPPWAVCFDHEDKAAHAEYGIVADKLNEHLLAHGDWHDPQHKRDGRVVSWTPEKKEAKTAL